VFHERDTASGDADLLDFLKTSETGRQFLGSLGLKAANLILCGDEFLVRSRSSTLMVKV
jgi:hypothetical protein